MNDFDYFLQNEKTIVELLDIFKENTAISFKNILISNKGIVKDTLLGKREVYVIERFIDE